MTLSDLDRSQGDIRGRGGIKEIMTVAEDGKQRAMTYMAERRHFADCNSPQSTNHSRDGFALLAMGFTGQKALGFKLRDTLGIPCDASPMETGGLRFQFDEKKGVEALIYIASQWPDVTAFFIAKVFFLAEKWHLNRYARPIIGDTFIAMPNGPVPSMIYDFIKGQLDQAGDPDAIMAALRIERNPHLRVTAQRDPDGDVLSPSDIECLDEAVAFCRAHTFSALSTLTHRERAWLEAPANGPMDYEAMIEGEDRDAILAEAREFAAYGVL